MSNIPALTAANMALTQQAIALEVLKKSADMQDQIATMLQESIATAPVSASRGTSVNIAA